MNIPFPFSESQASIKDPRQIGSGTGQLGTILATSGTAVWALSPRLRFSRHADMHGLLTIQSDCHEFSSIGKKMEQSPCPSPLSAEVKRNRPEGGNG